MLVCVRYFLLFCYLQTHFSFDCYPSIRFNHHSFLYIYYIYILYIIIALVLMTLCSQRLETIGPNSRTKMIILMLMVMNEQHQQQQKERFGHEWIPYGVLEICSSGNDDNSRNEIKSTHKRVEFFLFCSLFLCCAAVLSVLYGTVISFLFSLCYAICTYFTMLYNII